MVIQPYQPNTPGLFSMPDAEYRKAPGISQSMVKKFMGARSPYHYKYETEHPKADTPARRIGSAVDTRFLSGAEEFDSRFAVWMKDRRGKEWEKFEAENSGKSILNATEFTRYNAILMALNDDEIVKIRQRSATHICAFAYDSEQKVWLKSQFDMLPQEKSDWVFDLKCLEDGSTDGFRDAVFGLGHHIQAAFYFDILAMLGIVKRKFGFLCCEHEAPFAINKHTLESNSAEVDMGRRQIKFWLPRLVRCVQTDTWPGYSPWGQVTFTPWQLKQF